nr:PREDICTED: protein PET117 homolog, mitochondrial [Opisthocomus hoazin]
MRGGSLTLRFFAGGCRLIQRACLELPKRLHSGVLRDLERQNQKKENIRLLEEQIALTKQFVEERDKVLMEKGSQQS